MIVIDTHVLLWWAGGLLEKLSKPAKHYLREAEKSDGGILVSAISAWEIAILVQKGRLTLAMDTEEWLNNSSLLPGLQFLAIDRYTAVQSAHLPEPFHRDPADRIIVSTARVMGFPLVTSDQNIREYVHVQTIW